MNTHSSYGISVVPLKELQNRPSCQHNSDRHYLDICIRFCLYTIISMSIINCC